MQREAGISRVYSRNKCGLAFQFAAREGLFVEVLHEYRIGTFANADDRHEVGGT